MHQGWDPLWKHSVDSYCRVGGSVFQLGGPGVDLAEGQSLRWLLWPWRSVSNLHIVSPGVILGPCNWLKSPLASFGLCWNNKRLWNTRSKRENWWAWPFRDQKTLSFVKGGPQIAYLWGIAIFAFDSGRGLKGFLYNLAITHRSLPVTEHCGSLFALWVEIYSILQKACWTVRSVLKV